MIPRANVSPVIANPLPFCEMPRVEDETDEGFGNFRDTWWMGEVPAPEAAEVVHYEGEVLEALDRAAQSAEEFEELALAVEHGETDGLSKPLLSVYVKSGLSELAPAPDDAVLLGGLEIGVSGLAHALSAIRCPTAASCRSHFYERTWSDHPVVFFAAPKTRVTILAPLMRTAGCGFDTGRGMLLVYAPSVRETHALAELILREQRRFERKPRPQSLGGQIGLFDD
jgi:hypothetical protein